MSSNTCSMRHHDHKLTASMTASLPTSRTPAELAAYDLASKTAEGLTTLLGAHAAGFEMFLGRDCDMPGDREFDFVRVRVDIAFLLAVGRAQTVVRREGAANIAYERDPAPDRRVNGCGHVDSESADDYSDDDYSWSMKVTGTELRFVARRRRNIVFESCAIATRALLCRFDSTRTVPLSESEFPYLAADVRQVGPYLLLNEDSDEFHGLVAEYVPEVAAALVAEAMRDKVAQSQACVPAELSPDASQPPARRRLRV
jgi:hypothetical protein